MTGDSGDWDLTVRPGYDYMGRSLDSDDEGYDYMGRSLDSDDEEPKVSESDVPKRSEEVKVQTSKPAPSKSSKTATTKEKATQSDDQDNVRQSCVEPKSTSEDEKREGIDEDTVKGEQQKQQVTSQVTTALAELKIESKPKEEKTSTPKGKKKATEQTKKPSSESKSVKEEKAAVGSKSTGVITKEKKTEGTSSLKKALAEKKKNKAKKSLTVKKKKNPKVKSISKKRQGGFALFGKSKETGDWSCERNPMEEYLMSRERDEETMKADEKKPIEHLPMSRPKEEEIMKEEERQPIEELPVSRASQELKEGFEMVRTETYARGPYSQTPLFSDEHCTATHFAYIHSCY